MPRSSRRPRQREAIAHLRAADPVLRRLIDEVGTDALSESQLADSRDADPAIRQEREAPAGSHAPGSPDTRRAADRATAGAAPRPQDHYGALIRAIVGQQLSTKAARAIYTRLTERFNGRTPTPQEVLADDPDQLRAAAGLSRAKVVYLRSLAEHVLDGTLALERLDELPDDDVVAELTAVKGLGAWSAHMFLMFQLQRPDVLPVGDLGIRRAVMTRYELDELVASAALTAIAEPWRPHRTLACRFLWRSLDATPV